MHFFNRLIPLLLLCFNSCYVKLPVDRRSDFRFILENQASNKAKLYPKPRRDGFYFMPMERLVEKSLVVKWNKAFKDSMLNLDEHYSKHFLFRTDSTVFMSFSYPGSNPVVYYKANKPLFKKDQILYHSGMYTLKDTIYMELVYKIPSELKRFRFLYKGRISENRDTLYIDESKEGDSLAFKKVNIKCPFYQFPAVDSIPIPKILWLYQLK